MRAHLRAGRPVVCEARCMMHHILERKKEALGGVLVRERGSCGGVVCVGAARGLWDSGFFFFDGLVSG